MDWGLPRRRLGRLAAALLLVPALRGEVVVVARRSPDAPPAADVGVLRCWVPDVDLDGASVVVETPEGRVVSSQVVWKERGAPLDLRLDLDGRPEVVHVRVREAGTRNESALWEATAGVLVETRARVHDAVDSLAEVLAHWEQAAPPLGRSETDRIFDGIHRHGPTSNFLSHYRGWFEVPSAGRYGFATISDDASFLLINGVSVAEWPGWHGVDGGRHGEHHGWVDLEAGSHRIDYYNVQNESGFMVAAAWRPPGTDRFEIMPAEVFRPTARFEVERVVRSASRSIQVAFGWQPAGHVRAHGRMAIGMRFEVFEHRSPAPNEGDSDGAYRWRFPDGVVREGRHVEHLFASESLARIALEVQGQDGLWREGVEQPVRVAPDWSQRAEFDDNLYHRLREWLTPTVLSQMSPAFLAPWIQWADDVEDGDLLSRLASASLARLDGFGPADGEALYVLGFHLQAPAYRRYAETRRVWSTLLAMPGVDPELRGRTALHLGGMELHAFGRVEEAERHLREAETRLSGEADLRLLTIYRGDAAVLAGRIDDARTSYLQAGTVVREDDQHYEVRRVERIERARRFLEAGEMDAAERVARDVEWERPMERMGLETGLLLARAQRGRGEQEFARWTLRRLREVAAGDPLHAEVLWLTTVVLREGGSPEEAEEALRELFERYPYSEAAAWARLRAEH